MPPIPKSLKPTALSSVLLNGSTPAEPIWKGPERDGVTYSLLCRYLSCKERFRLLTIEGWKPIDRWNHRLEFGNMWHICEQALASERVHFGEVVGTTLWQDNLDQYCADLYNRYPYSRQEITHYYNVCIATFPQYVEYWASHPDVKNRTPLSQEHVFDVPYVLPSGRIVHLRGKWDSVDLVTEDGRAGIWLQENKTKSTIDSKGITQQLTFALQTMKYLTALTQAQENNRTGNTDDSLPDQLLQPVLGVRYNVVRRSMHKLTSKDGGYEVWDGFEGSGGRGPIGGFNLRIADMMREKPDEWFARWRVEVTQEDIKRFKRECLDPVLENLCDDYEWWDWCFSEGADVFDGMERQSAFMDHCPRQFRFPNGVFNPTLEGIESDYDELLNTGSTVGLQKVTNLFPELTGV